jgi:hypothetical protein
MSRIRYRKIEQKTHILHPEGLLSWKASRESNTGIMIAGPLTNLVLLDLGGASLHLLFRRHGSLVCIR